MSKFKVGDRVRGEGGGIYNVNEPIRSLAETREDGKGGKLMYSDVVKGIQDDHLGHMFCRAMMMYATGKAEEESK